MPDAALAPTGNLSHSAHHFETVTVYYRWHPFFGQSLRVRQRKKDRHGEFIVCLLPDDTTLSIPVWMSSPDCAQSSFGDPQIAITALVELRDLLSALQTPSGCDKALLTTFRMEAGDEGNKEAKRPAVESVVAERGDDSGPRQQAEGTNPRTGRTPDQRGWRRRQAASQRRSG